MPRADIFIHALAETSTSILLCVVLDVDVEVVVVLVVELVTTIPVVVSFERKKVDIDSLS